MFKTFKGLTSVGYMFPGSYATIDGVNATVKILETIDAPQEESDWRMRIDETMKLFSNEDMDVVALYFPEVRTIMYIQEIHN